MGAGHRAGLDGPRAAGSATCQRLAHARAGPPQRPHDTGFRDRPEGFPGQDRRRKHSVGLHRIDRRCDAGAGQRPRRAGGHRDLAPALLHPDAGLERGFRRGADPPSCRRPGMDPEAIPGDQALGRRDPGTRARGDPAQARGPFPRRHGASLGARCQRRQGCSCPATSCRSQPTRAAFRSCGATRT